MQGLREDLVLENEVNVVQREQLRKEQSHTSKILKNLQNLKKDHEEMLRNCEKEVNELYRGIAQAQDEIRAVQAEKMHEMHKVHRRAQEADIKDMEIKRFLKVKEEADADSEATQKQSDILQTGLHVVKEIGKSGEKEFESVSWRLQNNKKLVDSLIMRTGKAEDDSKMWEQRYKLCAKDLSYVQKLMMSMTSSHTETQAILYRDRALHYLKSVGGGEGVKEALPPINSESASAGSILSDALMDPDMRNEVGAVGYRASIVRCAHRIFDYCCCCAQFVPIAHFLRYIIIICLFFTSHPSCLLHR